MFLFCIPIGFYFGITTYLGKNKSKSATEWTNVIGSRIMIDPQRGIGPVHLGSAESQVYDLLGAPARSESNNSRSEAPKGRWIYYDKDSAAFGVFLSTDGKAERLSLSDFSQELICILVNCCVKSANFFRPRRPSKIKARETSMF